MIKLYTLLAAMTLALALHASQPRYAGGDISLLPEYENAGAQYKDHDGNNIAELLPYLHKEGMNAMRVRLFVNPGDYPSNDPNACQSLEYITPLCRRIVDAGFDLMLDFHYSDTWADPAKQWTPKAWARLSDEQLYETIYDYTRQTLLSLKEAGVTPAFIQTGNEISYGMLWGTDDTPDNQLKKTFMGSDANWSRLGHLLRQAIKACREICPDAKIVLHNERVAQPSVLKHFYDMMRQLDVSYEIIGLSYYPYFHGDISTLRKALDTVTATFADKKVMIVETGYSYKWEVPGTDHKVDYPYSDAGQNEFMKALVDTALDYAQVDGIFWWWMEYNAYGTSLSGWYNAPLFDSTTGCATSALKTLCGFATGATSVNDIRSDFTFSDQSSWYDMQGRRIQIPSTGKIPAGIYLVRTPDGMRKVMIP